MNLRDDLHDSEENPKKINLEEKLLKETFNFP